MRTVAVPPAVPLGPGGFRGFAFLLKRIPRSSYKEHDILINIYSKVYKDLQYGCRKKTCLQFPVVLYFIQMLKPGSRHTKKPIEYSRQKQAQWHTPLIPAPWRQRQEDLFVFKASLVYIDSSWTIRVSRLHREEKNSSLLLFFVFNLKKYSRQSFY